MKTLIIVVVIAVVLVLILLALAMRIVWQYEQGVLFRLGRLRGSRAPGLRLIIPFIDVLHKVSLRIVTMPIQSQGIITRDNVSVDVSAVACHGRSPGQCSPGWPVRAAGAGARPRPDQEGLPRSGTAGKDQGSASSLAQEVSHAPQFGQGAVVR